MGGSSNSTNAWSGTGQPMGGGPQGPKMPWQQFQPSSVSSVSAMPSTGNPAQQNGAGPVSPVPPQQPTGPQNFVPPQQPTAPQSFVPPMGDAGPPSAPQNFVPPQQQNASGGTGGPGAAVDQSQLPPWQSGPIGQAWGQLPAQSQQMLQPIFQAMQGIPQLSSLFNQQSTPQQSLGGATSPWFKSPWA
jgi:hypothetical protein